MLRVSLAVFFLVLCAGVARAQEAPKIEVFGGYSYANTEIDGQDRINANGWEASVTVNANRYFGLELGASGHYDTGHRVDLFGPSPSPGPDVRVDTRMHTFLAGPKVSLRGERFTPFGHVLFGVIGRESTVEIGPGPSFESPYSDSQFAAAVGGGLDVKLTERISIRAIQADYVNAKLFTPTGTSPNHARLSAGVVFTFGR